jgi:hypothetical protein
MGTNYYLQRRDKETGRCSDVHICKKSFGWSPSLAGYKEGMHMPHYNMPEITTWQQWKWFLMEEIAIGGLIFNEYDEPQELKDFFEFIEDSQLAAIERGDNNHAVYVLKDTPEDKRHWIDDEGYSFTAIEFS